MAQKHRRSNREAKKPKQKKSKPAASTAPFAALHSNPAYGVVAKRK
jgi:hypothetical protein